MAREWVAGAGDAFAAACAGPVCLAGGEWVAWSATFADLWGDAAFFDCSAEWVAAVAAIGPDLDGLVAGGGERINEWQQVRAFVFVAGPSRTASGQPLASTARWYLVEGKPRLTGLGPVRSPPFLRR